ncbi:peptidoglycan DD-metalloendopeptidase family protein [Desulfovibrio aminophilus]|uniref:M23 family metallopeptidase n=1 Tax=Desulfovibrio aminophilus TaxID=81425 RepID=UPI0033913831
MLFEEYRIVCLNSQGQPRLTFRLRGWHTALAVCLLALLFGTTAVFLPLSLTKVRERSQLDANRQAVMEQRKRIYAASFQLKSMEDGFGRIAEFDSKLRVMLSLAEGPEQEVNGMGGPLPGPYRNPLQLLYTQSLLRDMRERLGDLEISMLLEEASQQTLFHAVSAQQERLARIPVIWPSRGRFTSRFGWRASPLTGKSRFHKGIDITAPTGTRIKATAQGRVVLAEWFSTYGQCVEIDHGGGIHTRYGHMSKILVKEGQTVFRGDVIGLVGSTGRSVAPHVHYEVHVGGNPTNPLNYILK